MIQGMKFFIMWNMMTIFCLRFFLDIDHDFECSPEEGQQKIINLIEDLIIWLAKFINSDKSITNVMYWRENEIQQLLWNGVVATQSNNPKKVSTHIIFTNLYIHVSTMKI